MIRVSQIDPPQAIRSHMIQPNSAGNAALGLSLMAILFFIVAIAFALFRMFAPLQYRLALIAFCIKFLPLR